MNIYRSSKVWGLVLLIATLAGFANPAFAQTTVTYFHVDLQGSPVAASDSNGNVSWRQEYRPYGERQNYPTNAFSSRTWFTGSVVQEDTGLSYMGDRYFDSELGRFYSIDPVSVQTDQPVTSFNRYSYAANSPYRYTDTAGRIPVDTIWDVLSVAYDAGKIGVGTAIGNPALVAEGTIDIAADTVALAIPYVPAGATKVARFVAKKATKVAGLRRPYIRKAVKAEVDTSKRLADGRLLDPNTGLPINGKPDLGHKRGNELWRERDAAEAEGLTQKQFNDRMNDAKLYQWEDAASNRSHKYEKPR